MRYTRSIAIAPVFIGTVLALASLFSPIGLSSLGIEGTAFFYGHGDLLYHFALFYFAALLTLLCQTRVQTALIIVLLVIGIASEVTQALYVTGREGSMIDALVNTVAVLLVPAIKLVFRALKSHSN